MTLQMACFVVGTGTCMDTGVSVCVITKCDVGDVGGIVAVVGGTRFPSLSSGDNIILAGAGHVGSVVAVAAAGGLLSPSHSLQKTKKEE